MSKSKSKYKGGDKIVVKSLDGYEQSCGNGDELTVGKSYEVVKVNPDGDGTVCVIADNGIHWWINCSDIDHRFKIGDRVVVTPTNESVYALDNAGKEFCITDIDRDGDAWCSQNAHDNDICFSSCNLVLLGEESAPQGKTIPLDEAICKIREDIGERTQYSFSFDLKSGVDDDTEYTIFKVARDRATREEILLAVNAMLDAAEAV